MRPTWPKPSKGPSSRENATIVVQKIKILIRDCIKETDAWKRWHLIKEIQVTKK